MVVSLWAAVASAQPVSPPPPASSCQGAPACEKECERGNAAACSRAGKALDGTPLRAMGLYQRGCDGGDGAGCAALAAMYRTGRGVQPDAQRAFAYENAACERRHGASCLSLARAFERGAAGLVDSKRMADDMARTLPLYFKACDTGQAQGCSELARLYLWGVGTKADPVGGAVLAQRGCDKGDPAGCALLGYLYQVGWGVTADATRAADFARRGRGPREPVFAAPPVPRSVPATLDIASDPTGLIVTVDKMIVGRTPVSAVVPAGQRQVEAVAEGLGPLAVTVKVEAKKQTPVLLAWPGSLRLEASVAGATASIDGQAPLKLPWAGVVAAGAHSVRVEAPGYEGLTRAVTIKSGQELVERVTLQAQASSLQVDSTPAGAAVKLDETVVGVTPWSGPIGPGAHSLLVELAGYQPVRKALTVAPGKPLVENFTLTTETATVSLGSTPRGAAVSVDGQAVGTTPWSGKLAVGEHAVQLSLAGHGTVSDLVQVAAGKANTRTWSLLPLPGSLVVDSVPPGASVKVDGAVVGVTPWSGEVKAGSHALVVELAGHQPVRRALSVKAGEPVTERLTLATATLPVTLTSTPKGAAVTLDGQAVGVTPWRGPLSAGAHAVSLTLDGYEALDATLEVGGQQPTSRAFTLVALPRAVSITSEPSGAEVLLDAAKVGVTPWSGEVALGRHLLAVQAPGHVAFKKTLQVSAGPRLTEHAVLKAELVAVRITSTPPGAAVTVDGKKVGLTPWSGKLPVGPRAIEVARAGLLPATETLALPSGAGTTTKQYALSAEPTKLALTSVPPAAEVFIDGARVGATPWEGLVAAGARAVALRRPGYQEAAATVEVALGTTVTRELKLEPLLADVTIVTQPPGALLVVDGVEAGASPRTLPLPSGAHRLTATLDGHRPAELPFDLEGAPRTLTLELAPEAPLVSADAPPPAPPVTPPDDAAGHRAVLKDAKATLEAKQAALDALAARQKNLSEFLEEVEPPAARDALCVRWKERVTPALVTVASKDSFGDDQAAMLLGPGGEQLAQLPWEGPLPACLGTLVAQVPGGARQERQVSLKVGERNELRFDFAGRPPRVVASAFGEAAYVAPPFRVGSEFHFGGGARLDYWGRWFHFTFAVKAQTMYADLLALPVIPAIDLFFGVGSGFGTSTARFYFSFDVGAWTIATPTVRLSLALSLFDRVFFTGGVMAHLHPLGLLPPWERGAQADLPFEQFIFPGASFGVGYGW